LHRLLEQHETVKLLESIRVKEPPQLSRAQSTALHGTTRDTVRAKSRGKRQIGSNDSPVRSPPHISRSLTLGAASSLPLSKTTVEVLDMDQDLTPRLDNDAGELISSLLPLNFASLQLNIECLSVSVVIDRTMRTDMSTAVLLCLHPAVRSPEPGKPGTQQQQQRALAAAGTALHRTAAEDAALAAEREQGSMTFASQQAMAQQLVAGAPAGAEYVPAPLTTLTQLQVVRCATAVADVCTHSDSVASSGM
jgi:hypothetical protein